MVTINTTTKFVVLIWCLHLKNKPSTIQPFASTSTFVTLACPLKSTLLEVSSIGLLIVAAVAAETLFAASNALSKNPFETTNSIGRATRLIAIEYSRQSAMHNPAATMRQSPFDAGLSQHQNQRQILNHFRLSIAMEQLPVCCTHNN
jgi:hypothetical protein